MGVKNAAKTLVITLLALPWTLKPIWSPMLEMYRTKKFFVVQMQLKPHVAGTVNEVIVTMDKCGAPLAIRQTEPEPGISKLMRSFSVTSGRLSTKV